MQRSCEVCGAPFETTVQRRDGRGTYERQYCSKSCGTQAKGHPQTISCQVCGASMRLSQRVARERRLCSVACRSAYLRAHPPNPLLGRKVVRGYIQIHYPEHPQADKNGYVWRSEEHTSELQSL